MFAEMTRKTIGEWVVQAAITSAIGVTFIETIEGLKNRRHDKKATQPDVASVTL